MILNDIIYPTNLISTNPNTLLKSGYIFNLI